MSKHKYRLQDLAATAGLELDEALVLLWDNGLNDLLDPTDVIPARQLAVAQRTLGITTISEQLTIAYWLNLSGLEPNEFRRKAEDFGILISAQARKIPKGALGRMRLAFGSVLSEPEVNQATIVHPNLPPLNWEIIGVNPPTRFITLEEIKEIHVALENDFRGSDDPIFPEGVKDEGLLDSALSRPRTSFGGQTKYPTIEMAIAAVVHSIVHNHAFHNGNKRTGLVALLVLLDEHHMMLTAREAELFRFFLRISGHNIVPTGATEFADREVLEIARWIRVNSRMVNRAEHSLKWIKLKQRLRDFDCTFDSAPGVGNRLNVSRTIQTPRRFLPAKREILTVQVHCAGDGTDADKNVVHEIRKKLQLDDDHGYDSTAFYAGSEIIIDAFIVEYRHILKRLAKF